MSSLMQLQHGTHYAYQHRGCRCDMCVEYHRRTQREWRQRRRAEGAEPTARHVRALNLILLVTSEIDTPLDVQIALIAEIAEIVLQGGDAEVCIQRASTSTTTAITAPATAAPPPAHRSFSSNVVGGGASRIRRSRSARAKASASPYTR